MEASLDNFFPAGIPFEPDCEIHSQCDPDEIGWRGVNVRSLAVVSKLAPFTAETVLDVLRTTAKAAAESCVGGKCGTYWDVLGDEEEERGDLLRQMNALSAISNLLIEEAAAPVVRPPPPSEDEDENEEDGDGDDNGGSGSGSGENEGDAGDDGDDSSNDSDNDEGAGQSQLNGLSLSLLAVGLASTWLGSNL